MIPRSCALFLLLTLAACPGAHAQATIPRLSDALGTPTIKLSQLTPEWKSLRVQMTPEAKSEEGGGMLGMIGSLMGGMFGGGMGSLLTPPPPRAYTRGVTLDLGGEMFILVYRPPQQSLDMTAIMKAGEGADLPPPESLKESTELTASLIRLRSVQALTDIRPFDMKYEIAESERAAQIEATIRKEIGKKGGGLGGLGGGLGAAPAADEGVATMPDLRPEPAKPAPAKKPAPPKKASPKKK